MFDSVLALEYVLENLSTPPEVLSTALILGEASSPTTDHYIEDGLDNWKIEDQRAIVEYVLMGQPLQKQELYDAITNPNSYLSQFLIRRVSEECCGSYEKMSRWVDTEGLMFTTGLKIETLVRLFPGAQTEFHSV